MAGFLDKVKQNVNKATGNIAAAGKTVSKAINGNTTSTTSNDKIADNINKITNATKNMANTVSGVGKVVTGQQPSSPTIGATLGLLSGAAVGNGASALGNNSSTSSNSSSKGGYSRRVSYGSGSGSGSGVTSLGDNSEELAAEAARQQAEAQAAALRAQMQAREDAINAANIALDQQANAMRDKYTASLAALANDYQNLRNQAEGARYRAMYNQREALANRGALDSGAGRQETLAMNTRYNDNLNAINLQEAAEVAAINNAINQMYASVAQQKAANMNTTLNDYAQRLQNTINAIYSGYTPENSEYYQLANNVLQNATSPSISTPPEETRSIGTPPEAKRNYVGAAYTELLRRMGYNV